MDRVRFGRALGTGARQAAKSLLSAADAVAAPSPTASRQTARPPETAGPAAARPTPPVCPIPEPTVVKAQARSLGRSVWGPFARFSSVLWLEVTGVFFGIFALIAGEQIWKWHAAIRLSPSDPDARRLYVYVIIFVLFGYFAVSSFIRANRRQRR
jgi:hypothetical protein